VAYLAGQFLTPLAIGSLLAWSFWRRSPYLTGTITLLVAASSVGITNLPKVLDSLAAIESKAALRDVSDPSQIEDVIKKNPSNSVLQLLEVAYRAASDTSQVTQKLFDEIEPSSLANCGRDRAALC
jgi:hypothetical protein